MTEKKNELNPDYFRKINEFTASKVPPVVVTTMEALLTVAGVPEIAIPAVKELIEKFIRGERERCIEICKHYVNQKTASIIEEAINKYD